MNFCKVTLKFTAHGYGHTVIPIHDNPLHLQTTLGNLWFCFCSLRKHSVHVLNSPRSINLFWCQTVCAKKRVKIPIIVTRVVYYYYTWYVGIVFGLRFVLGLKEALIISKKKKINKYFSFKQVYWVSTVFFLCYILAKIVQPQTKNMYSTAQQWVILFSIFFQCTTLFN